MESIKNSFITDINQLKGLVNMLSELEIYKSIPQDAQEDINDFVSKSKGVQQKIKDNSLGLPILKGTTVLYLSGRFESFVRDLFEECAIKVATSKENFSELPEKMKTEILKKSIDVIGGAKKYGFDETQKNQFIKILNKNFNENDSSQINHQCLSITNTNMRPDAITTMYKIIGVEVWPEAGKQASLKTFLSVRNDREATDQAKALLEEIMEVRNSIAHPADSLSWPDGVTLVKYCKFMEVLSNVIYDVCNVHLCTLNS